MRRWLGLLILLGTALFTIPVALSVLMDARQRVVIDIAHWPADAPAIGDQAFLSLQGAQLSSAVPWQPRPLPGGYLIPLFAANDVPGHGPPRALLRLAAARLVERIEPPDTVDGGIRIRAAGRLSADCLSEARQAFGAAPLAGLACIDDAPAPPEAARVLPGLALLAIPLILLGLWLRRSAPRACALRFSPRLAKAAVILAFIVLVPLARLGDDAVPIVRQAPDMRPRATELATGAARRVPRPLADDMDYLDLSQHESLALEALGKAKEISDWYHRLDKLGLLPDAQAHHELQQLDMRLVFRRDADGVYLRHSGHTLMEVRLRRDGDILANALLTGPGYLAWDGVKLIPTATGELRYVGLLRGLNRYQRGTLRFEHGDLAAWRAGLPTTLRGDTPPLVVSLHGAHLVVRAGPAPPARLPPR
jgi:hypothetical protein